MYAGILYVSILLTVIKLTLQIILGCMLFLHPRAPSDRSLAGQIWLKREKALYFPNIAEQAWF